MLVAVPTFVGDKMIKSVDFLLKIFKKILKVVQILV